MAACRRITTSQMVACAARAMRIVRGFVLLMTLRRALRLRTLLLGTGFIMTLRRLLTSMRTDWA